MMITIDSSISSGQITIIPKPELRGFWGDSLTKPPFGVTSAEVVIICPDIINISFFADPTILIGNPSEIKGNVSLGSHPPNFSPKTFQMTKLPMFCGWEVDPKHTP